MPMGKYIRTKEHSEHIKQALNNIETKNRIGNKTRLILSDPEIRKRISENTKKAFANGKPKLTMIKGNIGDTICTCKLGKSYCRTLSWCACPQCGEERWVRVHLIGKLCTICAHKTNDIKDKISRGTLQSYVNNPELCNNRKTWVTNSWKNLDIANRRVSTWAKSIKAKPNKAERKLNLIIQSICKRRYALNVKGNIMVLGGKIPILAPSFIA
jgi:hypothetical protein